MLRDEFDAIFIGALGDPRVPDNRHARDILLGTRFELDLYVNYRPVRLLDERLCPLKGRGPTDVNFVVFRENTEGAVRRHRRPVQGGHRGRDCDPGRDQHLQGRAPHHPSRVRVRDGARPDEGLHGGQEQRHDRTATRCGSACSRKSRRSIRRSARRTTTSTRWRCTWCSIPAQFQVIVTNNLFGDIITDLGATFQGGLGMAASGNIHPGRTSMFEPVHGSAPKFAGKNIANPIGAIASAALMLETLGLARRGRGDRCRGAEGRAGRKVTQDIGGTLGTREAGDSIVATLLDRTACHGRFAESRMH